MADVNYKIRFAKSTNDASAKPKAFIVKLVTGIVLMVASKSLKWTDLTYNFKKQEGKDTS